LTEEQDPDIESMLMREANKYYKKKDHQRLKVNANATPDDSSTLFRLDGFEKQLDECKALPKQMEKNTIESQLDEERKRLKAEYNKVFDDIRNLSHTIKQQLEDQ